MNRQPITIGTDERGNEIQVTTLQDGTRWNLYAECELCEAEYWRLVDAAMSEYDECDCRLPEQVCSVCGGAS